MHTILLQIRHLKSCGSQKRGRGLTAVSSTAPVTAHSVCIDRGCCFALFKDGFDEVPIFGFFFTEVEKMKA